MKLVKYRIVTDIIDGYCCEIWRIWFPLWISMGQMTPNNSFRYIQEAKDYIERSKRKPVWNN